jgi:hypothetical protein
MDLQEAMKYYSAGLRIFPVTDTKQPACKGWALYRENQNESDIKQLFKKGTYGCALICADGIEVIDIDTKNDPYRFADDKSLRFEVKFFALVKKEIPNLLERLVIQRTQSGGWHLIYKCMNPKGNVKLAKFKGAKEAILETRGIGGYICLAPTPLYKIVQNDILDIPIITNEERNALISLCMSFDESEREEYVERKAKPAIEYKEDETPCWKAYNESNEVFHLLLANGWTIERETSTNTLLTRPGKTKGISASLRKSDNTFYCFSSSTEFESEKAYSPFFVFAKLAHSGDFSSAAKDLYQKGFGTRHEPKKEAIKASVTPVVETAKQNINLDSVKFDFNAPITESNTILNVIVNNERFKIAGLGNLVVIAGGQKSRKSTVGNAIMAAGLSNNGVINFTLDLQGKKVLSFDTEQPFERFQKSQHRLFKIAQKTGNLSNYNAYALRGFSKIDRLAAIEKQILETDNLGVVLLDGIVDLINDYNDLKESSTLVERLMQWTDKKQILLIVVLHLTKTSAQLRGHLGTELQNKADAVIETSKNENEGWTDIICRESREIPFPSFQFTQDKTGMPCLELPTEQNVNWSEVRTLYPTNKQDLLMDEVPF